MGDSFTGQKIQPTVSGYSLRTLFFR